MIFLTKTSNLNEDVFVNKEKIYNLTFISALFIFGMLVGAFSINICNDSEYYGISLYFDNYIEFLKENSFLNLFYSYFCVFSVLLLINFSLGLCLIGRFVSSIILFLYSFAIGSVSSFLYSKYSIAGLKCFAISILPCLFLLTINYLLCFMNTFNFSKKLLLLCKNNNVSINFVVYIFKYSIHFVLTVLISLLFALFSRIFISLF